MKLAGKTAVITGGGTGIGLSIARFFAQEGCRVALGGRRLDKLQEAATAIGGEHPPLCHELDVADRDGVNAFFDWAQTQLGGVDILVNSAGMNIATRSMATMEPEQWDQVLAVNATGAYNCMHAVLPQMRARRGGLIINISSISGLRAYELGGIAYCASKFAMAALGTGVNNEDSAAGIRVTNVYPGEVDTPILENRPTPVTAEHRARILQPEDVASVVLTIACLPPRANVPEVVVKPSAQPFV
ncbi:SDR family oxidoreductase [Lignipirellula cremea]|uniref:Putative oxidoreductase n=1 Tax=Lignipirellula cremea TaxID=2528010 RepID=A0A518DMU6_9BACT|nr:SDR family oxidoreductase [Lignipirellula cremea]QDU93164.1 putative oxidoreductase [Lignipirellula cremea]